MDKFELLGVILQDLRDSHGPDEEDLRPAILREMTKIYELAVRYGYLHRDMFDLAGIREDGSDWTMPKRYKSYQTTNYPITYVAFGNSFAEWLLGEDMRDRLNLIDIVELVREYSWMVIEITPKHGGAQVVARAEKYDRSFNFEAYFPA